MKKNLEKLLSILMLVLFFNSSFSQTNFPEEPKEYKKINFVYEQKSNYYIDDRGVFADTLLFKVDFPNIKYRKVINPNDSINVCGLVLLRDFKGEDRRHFCGIIYHTNQTYYGTYDASKNLTTFNIVRNDTKTRDIFGKYFSERYSKFEMNLYFDYSEMVPDDFHKIIYTKDKTAGTFKKIWNNILFENIVILNPSLNKKITTNTFFSNNDFGVQKIITIHDTMTLIKVAYK